MIRALGRFARICVNVKPIKTAFRRKERGMDEEIVESDLHHFVVDPMGWGLLLLYAYASNICGE